MMSNANIIEARTRNMTNGFEDESSFDDGELSTKTHVRSVTIYTVVDKGCEVIASPLIDTSRLSAALLLQLAHAQHSSIVAVGRSGTRLPTRTEVFLSTATVRSFFCSDPIGPLSVEQLNSLSPLSRTGQLSQSIEFEDSAIDPKSAMASALEHLMVMKKKKKTINSPSNQRRRRCYKREGAMKTSVSNALCVPIIMSVS